jgi:hypothetical protein
MNTLIHHHLNFDGRYPFSRPGLDRPLRDPEASQEDD